MVDIIDVVQKRGKPQLFIPPCCLPYPLHRIWQVRVSLHGQSLPGTESRTCFVGTDSPWSGPFPPQPPPAKIPLTFVRPLPRYIWACPTSHIRPSLSCSLGIHSANLDAICQGQTWDLPVPVRKASVRAWGLRPRGVETSLAITIRSILPSGHVDAVYTPKKTLFRGSIPSPHVPLSTLRALPYEHARMTRSR